MYVYIEALWFIDDLLCLQDTLGCNTLTCIIVDLCAFCVYTINGACMCLCGTSTYVPRQVVPSELRKKPLLQ